MRAGRSRRPSTQGWSRARRTILASDTVNFLAALVLYFLAVGGVRGFAFTLGLTTIVDLAVVFMLTHPVLALLARRGSSARATGSPASTRRRLGGRAATSAAAVSSGPDEPAEPGAEPERRLTIAERRAAARRRLRSHRGEGRLMASTRMSRWGTDLYTGRGPTRSSSDAGGGTRSPA